MALAAQAKSLAVSADGSCRPRVKDLSEGEVVRIEQSTGQILAFCPSPLAKQRISRTKDMGAETSGRRRASC